MWGKNFEKCVECGTTEREHIALGFCSFCYFKKYRKNPENFKRLKKQKRQWYIQNRDLKEQKKDREKRHFDGKRVSVLKRDNYTCQKCGDTNRANLVVHHEDGAGRGAKIKNNDLSNLITLCRGCHLKVHKKELKAGHDAWNKEKGWSHKIDCCIECGTSEKKYGAHGLCVNCYATFLRSKKPKKERVGIKLTKQDVLSIRELVSKHSQAEVARRFNINSSTVHEIVHRKIWKHI